MGQDKIKNSMEQGQHPDELEKARLEAEGWQRASGVEFTHTTPLNPATGKFEPKEIKTPEDIKREYLEKYGPHGFTEVLLVHTHSNESGLGWVEDPYGYYVYLRRPRDKKSEQQNQRPKVLEDFITQRKIQSADIALIDQLASFPKDMIITELHNMFNMFHDRASQELEGLIKTSQDKTKTALYQAALDFYNKYGWQASYSLIRILEGEII